MIRSYARADRAAARAFRVMLQAAAATMTCAAAAYAGMLL